MPFSFLDLILGLLLPALAAMLLTLVATPIMRGTWLARLAPVAMVVGFLLGYWALKLGPIQPSIDRHWIPYTAVLALLPSVMLDQGRVVRGLQFLALSLATLLAAYLVVPTWESLEPAREIYLSGYTVVVVVLCASMMMIARRHAPADEPGERPSRGRLLFPAMMMLALGSAGGLLALSGSLRFAQMAAAGMAALAGVTVALCLSRHRPALEGLAPVFALLMGSLLLTGYLNSYSDIPASSYLLLPLTPLAFALAPVPAADRPRSARQMILPASVAIVICAIALGLAAAAEFWPGES